MNGIKSQALVAALTLAVASTAFAQGRHDEKPHGQKPAQASKEGKSQPPAMGGRHDEKPHGQPQGKSGKEAAGKTGGMKKDMMKNEGEMGKGMK